MRYGILLFLDTFMYNPATGALQTVPRFSLQDLLLCIYGSALILISLIRFFRPGFLCSSALLTELREKGIETPYLRSRRIIGLILGASIVLSGVLPAPEKLSVALPLLALVFIALLACNKHYLGRFTPKKWF